MSQVFDAIQVGSVKTLTFYFDSDLAVGEGINSASVVATVYTGIDATPQNIVSGAAVISGGEVDQNIAPLVAGVVYVLACTAITSLGQTLVKDGFLAVVGGLA